MYKVDLHTHSIASPDGALTARDYKQMLDSGHLDWIAITDHDTIMFAADLHEQLGDRIIIGEEITTAAGEIIGLFLKERIAPGLTPGETPRQIRQQGGVVYIPHPFETVRRGLPRHVLDGLAADIDVIEIHNGRAVFQDKSADARRWATANQVPGAASSDAHGRIGWGKTFSALAAKPTKQTLPVLLGQADYGLQKVGWRGLLYPKLNRLRKRTRHVA